MVNSRKENFSEGNNHTKSKTPNTKNGIKICLVKSLDRNDSLSDIVLDLR